jgi:hypothetical protein
MYVISSLQYPAERLCWRNLRNQIYAEFSSFLKRRRGNLRSRGREKEQTGTKMRPVLISSPVTQFLKTKKNKKKKVQI